MNLCFVVAFKKQGQSFSVLLFPQINGLKEEFQFFLHFFIGNFQSNNFLDAKILDSAFLGNEHKVRFYAHFLLGTFLLNLLTPETPSF